MELADILGEIQKKVFVFAEFAGGEIAFAMEDDGKAFFLHA